MKTFIAVACVMATIYGCDDDIPSTSEVQHPVIDNHPLFDFSTPELNYYEEIEWGQLILDWSGVPGVDTYILERATRSDFGDAIIILQGRSRMFVGTLFDDPPPCFYYRVKAADRWSNVVSPHCGGEL